MVNSDLQNAGLIFLVILCLVIVGIATLYLTGSWIFSQATINSSNKNTNLIHRSGSAGAIVSASSNVDDSELPLGLKILGRGSVGIVAAVVGIGGMIVAFSGK
jgi:uncharacterized protein (UPF0333 family)